MKEILNKYKQLTNRLIKQLDTLTIDEILLNEKEKEIEIQIFPQNWGKFTDETLYRTKYYNECLQLSNQIADNTMLNTTQDIELGNSWNFIYVILE